MCITQWDIIQFAFSLTTIFFFFFLGLHVSTENVCFKTAYQLGPFCLFINRLDVLCVVPVKEPETFFSFNSMCLCAHTG